VPTYNLSVDLAPLAQALQLAEIEIANRAAQVVSNMASQIVSEWGDAVYRATGKGGLREAEREAYRDSIKTRPISPLEIEIYSDYKHAAEIETGRPARDLKRMLDTSTKVRISAKGAKYLIIPFRHNTPGSDALVASMPKDVYKIAKQMQLSSAVGSKTEMNAHGNPISRSVYDWGRAYSKLNKARTLIPARIPAGMMGPNPQGKVDRFAGMVRMKGDSARNISGGYLTFRVMTSNSNGWIVPAQPGLFIVKNIVDRCQPMFVTAMGEALKGALPTN
jgi:hypothetical protein